MCSEKSSKKAANCKPCTEICKNLKPKITGCRWKPQRTCSELNETVQIDFSGTIANEKDQDILFIACIDILPNYPTVELFDKTERSNVVKFLDGYIQIH